MNLYDKIQATAAFIKSRIKSTPVAGIILGSGLGDLTHAIDIETEIDYEGVPNFPVSTVKGHSGKLLFGKMNGVDVMLMAGRFHYYEGYSMEEVTFPVRVMKALGVEILILSNAAGGTNAVFAIGDLMIIKDHINLFPEHPLATEIAAKNNITVRTGTYVGLQGPTFETPAEYKWLHTIGCDAVGMSTVPEVIVARHGGMRVFAISVITDLGITDVPVIITHEEVLEAAHAAAPKMAALVTGIVGGLKK